MKMRYDYIVSFTAAANLTINRLTPYPYSANLTISRLTP